jgi:hypothetical protein
LARGRTSRRRRAPGRVKLNTDLMNSARLTCVLSVPSDVGHLQQLLTGFALLSASGVLRLKQDLALEDSGDGLLPRWAGHESYNLIATLNGRTRICYDTHDSGWIDKRVVQSVDFYFKRSFDPVWVRSNLPASEHAKVFPLGLNYQVESPGFDRFKIERARMWRGSDRIRNLLKGLAIDRLLPGSIATERMQAFEGLPLPDQEPRVLFMTRVWDPELLEDQSQRDAIRALNETRAACVRILREKLGDRYSGGLASDPYAIRHFGDCVLRADHYARKRLYLDLVRLHPICVATTGLNNSIGWKFAEYVALSRAVVSEPLHYQVPGRFLAGENYLEFTSANELLAAVETLLDRGRREQMMRRNREYYLAYVRPDVIVRNSLVTAGVLAS